MVVFLSGYIKILEQRFSKVGWLIVTKLVCDGIRLARLHGTPSLASASLDYLGRGRREGDQMNFEYCQSQCEEDQWDPEWMLTHTGQAFSGATEEEA